jgi:hypothetical protein
MRRTLLLAAALIAIPITAIAQEQAPPAAPTTPGEFVKARQANMGRGGGALAAMKQTADSGGDLAALAPRIEWLTHWSEELPTLFPEGSDTAESGARPEAGRTGPASPRRPSASAPPSRAWPPPPPPATAPPS